MRGVASPKQSYHITVVLYADLYNWVHNDWQLFKKNADPYLIVVYAALPGNKGAVLHHALLYVDSLCGIGLHHLAILIPEHLHVLVHKGGHALERQTVSLENYLMLGRSHLERWEL